MDKKQMEMLSVKNAIERMVQNYITTFQTTGSSKDFFDATERLVASFFVGGQIDNNHLVRSRNDGNLEIRFSVRGHCTALTFLLPDVLKWKVEAKTAVEEKIEKAFQSRKETAENTESPTPPPCARALNPEASWPFPTGKATPVESVGTIIPPGTYTGEQDNDDVRALKAYEAAKKAVKDM